MINSEQNKEIKYLVDELVTAHNNWQAEMETGHDWETYKGLFDEAQAELNQYLDTITA